MSAYQAESPLPLSGDPQRDIERLRNYIYERDMELRHILSHLDSSNFVDGFIDTLKPVVVETTGGTGSTVASDALSALGGQSNMSFATASTMSDEEVGGIDLNLQTFIEKDNNNVFSNARYSSSYGYGIKCAKAGYYLISAMANFETNASGSITATIGIRKVVGGTNSWLARALNCIEYTAINKPILFTIPQMVVYLEANSYLSLYLTTNKLQTNGNGCHLTAVYLGE